MRSSLATREKLQIADWLGSKAVMFSGSQIGDAPDAMKRLNQVLLIGTFLPLAWLCMMIVHEFGHVIAAWLTGGTVAKVILHPLVLSRTDLSYNPRPLLVSWAGPFLGSVIPLGIWLLGKGLRLDSLFLLRWFCGFCFVANGVYIGAGAFTEIGDADDMLVYGSAKWQLVLFGLIFTPAGFAIWNRLGKDFGLGESNGSVSKRAAIISAGLLIIVLSVELVIGAR
jgi:hypothetical protein